MTDLQVLASEILHDLLARIGVGAWRNPDTREELTTAALEMAAQILGIDDPPEPGDMAITATFRQQVGTTKTFKSSGGDYAITLTSVANAAARQAAKADLGATFATLWAVKADIEIGATPTAGATIDFYWAPSSSASAGTDEPGGIGGTDSAYTGYSSNLAASLKQLLYIGSLVTTAQATATVQKGHVGTFRPPNRYGTLVVVNNSGASLHSSATNMQVVLTPLEETAEA